MFEIEAKDIPQIEKAIRGELATHEIQYLAKKLQYTAEKLNIQICRQSLNEVVEAAKGGDRFYTPERAAQGALIILRQMVE